MRDSVPIARDIPAFVMYCVNGASRSSLLIESTYSMIIIILYDNNNTQIATIALPPLPLTTHPYMCKQYTSLLENATAMGEQISPHNSAQCFEFSIIS